MKKLGAILSGILLFIIIGCNDSELNYKPEKPFSIIILPDTQKYPRKYPDTFFGHMKWISDNKQALNIQHVLHVGDVTDCNAPDEWEIARDAFLYLGEICYTITIGNHDIIITDEDGIIIGTGDSLFSEYFTVSDAQLTPHFGGTYDPYEMENSYSLFDAGGRSWLIIATEYKPTDEVIDWANDVVNEYPTHLVILLTHRYMNSDGKRNGMGEYIWSKLVTKHSNFFMVVCGHRICPPRYRMDKGEYGNEVHQMQVNYQHIGKGGDGWLRILTFSMEDGIVEVQDYSPLLKKYSSDPLASFVISFQFLG